MDIFSERLGLATIVARSETDTKEIEPHDLAQRP